MYVLNYLLDNEKFLMHNVYCRTIHTQVKTNKQWHTHTHTNTQKPTTLKPQIKPLCVTFIEFWSNLANGNFITCMGNI